jgi:hypothetical protein
VAQKLNLQIPTPSGIKRVKKITHTHTQQKFWALLHSILGCHGVSRSMHERKTNMLAYSRGKMNCGVERLGIDCGVRGDTVKLS